MIKFILGAKGVGKTRWLIEEANKDLKNGNGNIAFVDVDDDHIFSLDYNIRLINATDYKIETLNSFYGFICGLCAMDFDLQKIYVDGLYKALDINVESLEELHRELSKVPGLKDREIYINAEYQLEDVTDYLKENSLEVTGE